MPLKLNVPDTRYQSVEELITKSAIVVRRVMIDKAWSCMNYIMENQNKRFPDTISSYEDCFSNGVHYTKQTNQFYDDSFDIEEYYLDRPNSNMITNPFSLPNPYLEQFFNESIDNTVIQSPIFQISKRFLQKISVRKNYREIIDELINNLMNDGLNNQYAYSIAILYFLSICYHWNLAQNHNSPDRFTNHDIWYTELVNRFAITITTMAVHKAMEICETCNITEVQIYGGTREYDLDDLLYEELCILDCTISDVLWQMHIGTDIVPLEGGLQDGSYDYFEDEDDILHYGDIKNENHNQPKRQEISFVW